MVRWFSDPDIQEQFPLKATYDNIMNLIWTPKKKSDKKPQEHWINAIFDLARGSIAKYNTNALIMQMIAAKIIGIEMRGDKLMWVLCRDRRHHFCGWRYNNTDYWIGVNLADKYHRKYKL